MATGLTTGTRYDGLSIGMIHKGRVKGRRVVATITLHADTGMPIGIGASTGRDGTIMTGRTGLSNV